MLHSFNGREDGSLPRGDLTNLGGTLYGTTMYGGVTRGYDGHGTAFSITTSGSESALYRFKGATDGSVPEAGLTDLGGRLYGTTASGGPSNNGTIFSITTSGTESVLYSFKKIRTHGATPAAGLTNVRGVLYGTTMNGGITDGYGGDGTVFKISCHMANCTETVVHSFNGYPNDGAVPAAGVTNVGGTLYGTTQYGGSYENPSYPGRIGLGTVFKITPSGTETVLHNFALTPTDGVIPSAGLTDLDGALYGTTIAGGAHNRGTVFRITSSGAYRQIYSFAGAPADGAVPNGLTDVGGTLYGTTDDGGANGDGTIFALSKSGQERVLYSFKGRKDGQNPSDSLIDVGGTLYGTTFGGGTYGHGTVFSFSP